MRLGGEPKGNLEAAWGEEARLMTGLAGEGETGLVADLVGVGGMRGGPVAA